MRTVALLSFLMLTAMLAGCTEVVYSCGHIRMQASIFDGTCGVGRKQFSTLAMNGFSYNSHTLDRCRGLHIIRVQVNNSECNNGNGIFPTTIVPLDDVDVERMVESPSWPIR